MPEIWNDYRPCWQVEAHGVYFRAETKIILWLSRHGYWVPDND